MHEPILFHNDLTSYLETNIKTEIIRFWSIKMKLYRFKNQDLILDQTVTRYLTLTPG